MAQAIREAKPDVVYVMLASESAPFTATSTGTHSVLLALRGFEAVCAAAPSASMADLCLKLGERAATGEAVPQWVGITTDSHQSVPRPRRNE